MKAIFEAYLNRLIDLSSRNKSLYLPKLLPSQMIDLNEFQFLHTHDSYDYIKQLLLRKKTIQLLASSDARNKTINLLSQRLKKLQHLLQLTENETGEKSFYMAWPFVEGKLINGQLIRCPLIFFPLSLKMTDGIWELNVDENQTPIFNKAFLLAYSHAYSQPLSESWASSDWDVFPKDSLAFRTHLYQWVTQQLTVNFTRELFEDKIINFPTTSKTLDEGNLEVGKLKLVSYAVLGQFSQKTSFLIEDYEELIRSASQEEMESFLVERFGQEVDFVPREDQLYTIFPTDASQEKVIKAVRSGRSCVVQGPPGTGKSQLIANLVIDYISRGKKVLVVSQKKAALDVVYQRLKSKGFSEFLALVHDIKTDKKALFKQLLFQIDAIEDYKQTNNSLDAIQLERRFIQLSRAIEQHSEFFNEFKNALYSTEECGKPIKELYVKGPLDGEFFELNHYLKDFTWDKVEQFLNDFQLYFYYYHKYQQADSFWLHRHDFSSFEPSAYYRLKEIFEEIDVCVTTAQKIFELEENDILSFFSLYPQKDKLIYLLENLQKKDSREVFREFDLNNEQEIDLLWLENKFLIIKKLLEEEIEWVTTDEEVEHLHFLAIQFAEKNKSWLKFPSILWDRSYWAPIYDLLKKNDLKNDAQGRFNLIRRLENRLNLNHQYTLLKSKKWLILPEKPFDFIQINHAATSNLEGLKARIAFQELERQHVKLNDFVTHPETLCDRLNKILSFFDVLENDWNSWEIYLSKIQIQHLLNGIVTGGNKQIKEQLSSTFEELVAFDRLKASLSLDATQVMEMMIENDAQNGIDVIKKKFLNGLRVGWIDYIESKYPILKEIMSPRAKIYHEEFLQAVEEKWEVSSKIAGLRLRENILKNLVYNRLNNLLTYRELRHQVSKQKKTWSIKQVTEKFDDEVFKLIPCWLASPETVSSIFSMQPNFDLIVFDESSQCYVERGLPSMLRGKQIVIAGDSQQLQPFDLYQVRLDTEEEGIAFETESLLDFASNYFETFTLESHYRSEQLPLIHFSNQKFYHDRLSMLTRFDLVNHPKNPFHFISVNGSWENQVNRVEAYTVVDKIKEIQQMGSQSKIGVITFNYFQMMLIQELVDATADIQLAHLSIKNIENVQGDEFDHVIFSIGYAKNKSGKLIANFGLLSKKGGKNRLNVAISRAKKSIALVTSLLPQDFSDVQLENEGVLLLRDYISFVQFVAAGGKIEINEQRSDAFLTHWLLCNQLAQEQEKTFKRYRQSPWMDLAVVQDDQYRLALLTDDFRFYDAKSSKEFMVYQAMQLKEKGWPFQYFYSREYWKGVDDFQKLLFNTND